VVTFAKAREKARFRNELKYKYTCSVDALEKVRFLSLPKWGLTIIWCTVPVARPEIV
jgi:hypothetical protein